MNEVYSKNKTEMEDHATDEDLLLLDARLLRALAAGPTTKEQDTLKDFNPHGSEYNALPTRTLDEPPSVNSRLLPPITHPITLRHPSIYAKHSAPEEEEDKEEPNTKDAKKVDEREIIEQIAVTPAPAPAPITTVIDIEESKSNRCVVCTLPTAACRCSETASKQTSTIQSNTDAKSSRLTQLKKPLMGLLPGLNRMLLFLNPFDPDDECRRSRTLSPYLTFFLWCRTLVRSVLVTSLSFDLERLHGEMLPWWIWYPAYPLSKLTGIALRPVVSLCFDVAALWLLLHFNRNTRKFLWLRPVMGLFASAWLALDSVSSAVLILRSNPLLLEDFTTITIGLIIVTQLLNIVAWFVAAHIVLAHDRSTDGDTDGTDQSGETSGSGAAGTGVSSYRQQQLIFVRAALWPQLDHNLLPLTPIPFRIHLIGVASLAATIGASLIFLTLASPTVTSMHQLRAEEFVSTKNESNGDTATESVVAFFEWDDPRLMLGVSVAVGVLSTLLALKQEARLFIATVRGLRSGKMSFTNVNRKLDMYDNCTGMAATGLLGFSLGWHFGVQIMISSGVALLYEMLSLSVLGYQNITVVSTANLGILQLLVLSIISLLLLFAVERYIIGAHRCLRPRHLLGCLELSFLVFYSVAAMIMGIAYMLWLACTRNILVTPLVMEPPLFIKSVLHKSAENYEKSNNAILRLSAALMCRASNSKNGLKWDKDFVVAEATLSSQECATNAALRLFWFLMENPSMISETNSCCPNEKQLIRTTRILKSFPDLLTSSQVDMLKVGFDLLDSDQDGFVTLRDLRCAAATVPELIVLTEEDMYKIIQTIGVGSSYGFDKEQQKLQNENRFSLVEWISFLRHRLFLCDMTHHGPGAKDVRLYSIELRRLRGQLEGALKVQQKTRMMDKAIQLSGTISETEMLFWGAKIPVIDMFESLAERLGCSETTEAHDDDDLSLPNVLVKSTKLRPVLRAVLGKHLDHTVGDLVLDALKGSAQKATVRSLRK
jgi:hypothetical protein